ncbi:MAG: sulfite exporter TauE/SafE family protein [SAR324 cluster bacterium]|nr:sulfite exporter TauE/SafE family protein [SAR324 cluster bacterium]
MFYIVIGSIVVFVGSLVQGSVGFGFALIIVPTLLLILPQEHVTPVVVLLSLALNGVALYECHRILQKKTVFLLSISGILGVPFGVYLLQEVNAQAFKLIVGVLIVILACLLKTGWKRSPRNQTVAGFFPVGFVSGIMNGSIALNGPPVILFFTHIKLEKEVFRANLLGYFFISNCFTILYFVYSDLIHQQILYDSLIYYPSLLLGTVVGIKVSKRIPEKIFRNVVFLVVGVMGLALIVTNI